MGLKPPEMHPGLAGPRPRPRRPETAVSFEDKPPAWLTPDGLEPESHPASGENVMEQKPGPIRLPGNRE